MTGRAHSYIGEGTRRQSSNLVLGLALVLVGLSLGGCAGLGLPFGEAGSAGRMAARGEATKPILASATVTDQVDASDWETVRRTAEGAPVEASRLDWINPETGSSGRIAIAAAATDQDGVVCRSFATTVNDVRGIRRYRGEACVRTDGRSQFRGVIADDATLS
jgi:surface antigen